VLLSHINDTRTHAPPSIQNQDPAIVRALKAYSTRATELMSHRLAPAQPMAPKQECYRDEYAWPSLGLAPPNSSATDGWSRGPPLVEKRICESGASIVVAPSTFRNSEEEARGLSRRTDAERALLAASAIHDRDVQGAAKEALPQLLQLYFVSPEDIMSEWDSSEAGVADNARYPMHAWGGASYVSYFVDGGIAEDWRVTLAYLDFGGHGIVRTICRAIRTPPTNLKSAEFVGVVCADVSVAMDVCAGDCLFRTGGMVSRKPVSGNLSIKHFQSESFDYVLLDALPLSQRHQVASGKLLPDSDIRDNVLRDIIGKLENPDSKSRLWNAPMPVFDGPDPVGFLLPADCTG
jgi:hypothetical protein